jgi:hypothetical protein
MQVELYGGPFDGKMIDMKGIGLGNDGVFIPEHEGNGRFGMHLYQRSTLGRPPLMPEQFLYRGYLTPEQYRERCIKAMQQ